MEQPARAYIAAIQPLILDGIIKRWGSLFATLVATIIGIALSARSGGDDPSGAIWRAVLIFVVGLLVAASLVLFTVGYRLWLADQERIASATRERDALQAKYNAKPRGTEDRLADVLLRETRILNGQQVSAADVLSVIPDLCRDKEWADIREICQRVALGGDCTKSGAELSALRELLAVLKQYRLSEPAPGGYGLVATKEGVSMVLYLQERMKPAANGLAP